MICRSEDCPRIELHDKKTCVREAKRVEDRSFIKAWQNSRSLKEVAAKTGRKYWTVAWKATMLRKRGVQLKSMPRGWTQTEKRKRGPQEFVDGSSQLQGQGLL